jgi:hypothetical protein
MVAKVDIGEGMAKALLRRKHVASPADTIAPAVVDCLLRLRGGYCMSFEQMLSVSFGCDPAEAHSRRAKVRSCEAPILGTELDRLSGTVYLVLDEHIVKEQYIYAEQRTCLLLCQYEAKITT